MFTTGPQIDFSVTDYHSTMPIGRSAISAEGNTLKPATDLESGTAPESGGNRFGRLLRGVYDTARSVLSSVWSERRSSGPNNRFVPGGTTSDNLLPELTPCSVTPGMFADAALVGSMSGTGADVAALSAPPNPPGFEQAPIGDLPGTGSNTTTPTPAPAEPQFTVTVPPPPLPPGLQVVGPEVPAAPTFPSLPPVEIKGDWFSGIRLATPDLSGREGADDMISDGKSTPTPTRLAVAPLAPTDGFSLRGGYGDIISTQQPKVVVRTEYFGIPVVKETTSYVYGGTVAEAKDEIPPPRPVPGKDEKPEPKDGDGQKKDGKVEGKVAQHVTEDELAGIDFDGLDPYAPIRVADPLPVNNNDIANELVDVRTPAEKREQEVRRFGGPTAITGIAALALGAGMIVRMTPRPREDEQELNPR